MGKQVVGYLFACISYLTVLLVFGAGASDNAADSGLSINQFVDSEMQLVSARLNFVIPVGTSSWDAATINIRINKAFDLPYGTVLLSAFDEHGVLLAGRSFNIFQVEKSIRFEDPTRVNQWMKAFYLKTATVTASLKVNARINHAFYLKSLLKTQNTIVARTGNWLKPDSEPEGRLINELAD